MTNPTLINFEAYNPTSDAGFSTFFGSGTQVGYVGPNTYSGGGPDGGPNAALKPVAGQTGGSIDGGQDWALDFSLTQESLWGGGLQIWMTCANASAYKGISFWARGSTPPCPSDAGGGSCFEVALTTADTTPVGDGGVGTCVGASTTCVDPRATNLPLSLNWTQFQIPWAQFTGGATGATPYTPTGKNIISLTFVARVNWGPVEGGYAPIPADLDLQIDDISFMP